MMPAGEAQNGDDGKLTGREQSARSSAPPSQPQDLLRQTPSREGQGREGNKMATPAGGHTAADRAARSPTAVHRPGRDHGAMEFAEATEYKAGDDSGEKASKIANSSVRTPPLESSVPPDETGKLRDNALSRQATSDPSKGRLPTGKNGPLQEEGDGHAGTRLPGDDERENEVKPLLQTPRENLAAMFKDHASVKTPPKSASSGLPPHENNSRQHPETNLSGSFIMHIPEGEPVECSEQKGSSPSDAGPANKPSRSLGRTGAGSGWPSSSRGPFTQWGGGARGKDARQRRPQGLGGGGGGADGTESVLTEHSGGSGERRLRSVQRVRGGLAFAQETAGAAGKKAMQQSAAKAMKAFKVVQGEIDTGERLHSMFGIQKYTEEAKIQELLALERLGSEKDQLKFDLKILKYYTNTENDIELRDRRVRTAGC